MNFSWLNFIKEFLTPEYAFNKTPLNKPTSSNLNVFNFIIRIKCFYVAMRTQEMHADPYTGILGQLQAAPGYARTKITAACVLLANTKAIFF
jgi:hypothetical protein